MTLNHSKTYSAEEILCLDIIGDLNKVDYEWQEYV